jgi:hypothetical protein
MRIAGRCPPKSRIGFRQNVGRNCSRLVNVEVNITQAARCAAHLDAEIAQLTVECAIDIGRNILPPIADRFFGTVP